MDPRFGMMIVQVDESGKMLVGEDNKCWGTILSELSADAVIVGAKRLVAAILDDLAKETAVIQPEEKKIEVVTEMPKEIQ